MILGLEVLQSDGVDLVRCLSRGIQGHLDELLYLDSH
jgi:hypothetical protein